MAFLHDGDRSPQSLYVHDFTAKKTTRLWVHGGPGDQSRKGYGLFVQYLVNHGYVVMAANYRGSSGYGRTFVTADDQKHGREPLRDCLEARKYLASLPYVDGSRVGILGPSYGGYMVLAALAFHPDAFSVGVDAFGPSNWLRTLQDIPPAWEAARASLYQEMGDPVTQEAMLRDISPRFHTEQIRKPLIVFQGAQEPRVAKEETDAVVEAVRKNQVPIEYIVYPDEGHGFSQKKNELDSCSRILHFLDQYLRP